MKQKFSIYIIIFIFCFLFTSDVSARTGTILSGFDTTLVCHDSTCATPTPGILNFRPTGITAVVVDDVTGISGYIWGNELGWVLLNPTGEGVTFANPTTGLLTGMAWSQVSGWINFAPTGQSVTIDPVSGEFSGYAWTGGPFGGWIKFDCSSGDTCIKSDWGTGSSGGGGGGATRQRVPGGTVPIYQLDVCPNIEGDQNSIPGGYTVDYSGACIKVIDVCPNLSGDQEKVPTGFRKNAIGACVIPVINPDVPTEIDYCPNMTGVQSSIPSGMYIRGDGECVVLLPDLCSNLGGYQTTIPSGFFEQEGMCFYSIPEDVLEEGGMGVEIPIIGFPFIPQSWKIPSNNYPLKNIVKNVVSYDTKGDYRVDLISIGLTILLLIFLIRFLIVWLIRRYRR